MDESHTFCKASEIKAEKSPEFYCIHLKLGFHQLYFIGAGYKLMQDDGLKEVWSTLPKMLK